MIFEMGYPWFEARDLLQGEFHVFYHFLLSCATADKSIKPVK